MSKNWRKASFGIGRGRGVLFTYAKHCEQDNCAKMTMKENDMELEVLLKTQRDQILETAHKNGAFDVRVFGSVARGDARPDSDIDFLVRLEAGRSLLDLARLLRELQTLLGCNVDIVTEAGLRPRIRLQVLREARPL
jgi:predicted nucleotidyltransferase